MTIISLLLVLLVERITTKSQYWQFEFYFQKIFKTADSDTMHKEIKTWWWLGAIVLPVLLVYLLVQELSNGLLELVLSTALLLICVGCPAVRATYKHYLQAANRGDLEACDLYAAQISETDDDGIQTFGCNLVWQNYLHYAAVILWFTAFGASGALLYVLSRESQKYLRTNQDKAAIHSEKLMFVLDFIPVRVTALGFLLVGHFSRAFPIWFAYLFDMNISAKSLLLNVAKKAEEIEPDENDCTEEPCTLVRLAKRNIMFLMVAIALLTLSGWIN